jgi:hypothetical protein
MVSHDNNFRAQDWFDRWPDQRLRKRNVSIVDRLRSLMHRIKDTSADGQFRQRDSAMKDGSPRLKLR